jgi:hypothetical protein
MEEVVEAFKIARPEIMEVAKTMAKEVKAKSPKRKREEPVMEQESRKRTRSSGRTTRQSPQQVVVLDSEGEDDDDFVPGKLTSVVCSIIANLSNRS